MCAYVRPSGGSNSADSALTKNGHASPALKHLHDRHSGQKHVARISSSPGQSSPLRLDAGESSSAAPSPTAINDAVKALSTTSAQQKRKQTRNRHRQLHFAPSGANSPVLDAGPAHRHHKHRHHQNGYESPSSAGFYQNRHFLSRDNRSIQNLSTLDKLVDDRNNYCEEYRMSDEKLAEVGKRKNGAAIKAYYEQMNATLDTWREVDEILDSRFPEEVMLRFGSVQEVERFVGQHKRLAWMDGEIVESSDTESGYQEESEESEADTPKRYRKGGLARAASALSDFWFGSPTLSKMDKRTRRPRSSSRDDEESAGLLRDAEPGSTPDRPRGRSPLIAKYGATTILEESQPASSTAHDVAKQGEASVADGGHTSMPSRSAKEVERAGNAGVVRSTTPSGSKPTALENGVASAKATPKPRRYRRRSREDSGTESDDELEDESEPITAGKLDAKLAAEREERKARAKHREVTIPGTDGVKVMIDKESSASPGTSLERKQAPGGLSERDRMRLLQYVPGRQQREGEREKDAQFAININLAANVLLLAGKAFAVFSSNSVSLIASLVDSALDLLSTVIIFGTSKAISYRSFHTYFKYPVGKKRFEPLGVVIFAVLMIASFCQVLVESVERLAAVVRTGSEAPGEAAKLPLIGVAFMVLTIIIKAFMWIIYRRSPSSGVRAVAQDAENDVVFNVASLIFPIVGSRLGWPALDPIGGVCLSIYIIVEWLETLTETVTKLSGAVGSAQDISRALYLSMRFRSVISVSALEVYHAGDDMIVEADIVLPHGLALKEAHDLGEIITYCTENLTQVERAYIHLDYNPVGQAGHITGRG